MLILTIGSRHGSSSSSNFRLRAAIHFLNPGNSIHYFGSNLQPFEDSNRSRTILEIAGELYHVCWEDCLALCVLYPAETVDIWGYEGFSRTEGIEGQLGDFQRVGNTATSCDPPRTRGQSSESGRCSANLMMTDVRNSDGSGGGISRNCKLSSRHSSSIFAENFPQEDGIHDAKKDVSCQQTPYNTYTKNFSRERVIEGRQTSAGFVKTKPHMSLPPDVVYNTYTSARNSKYFDEYQRGPDFTRHDVKVISNRPRHI